MATGTEIIDQAKELADMTNSNFIPLATWQSWLNDAYAELYDILVGRFEDYYVGSLDLIIPDGQDSVALPSNFYKLRGIDRDNQTVRSFQFAERNSVDVSGFSDGVYNSAKYCLVGSNLMIRPKEKAPGTYTVWLVPRPQIILNFETAVVGIDGWEPFLHYTIAIKALIKEESDPMPLMQLKADIVRRIEEMAANRDAGEPKKISDVSRNEYRVSILGY